MTRIVRTARIVRPSAMPGAQEHREHRGRRARRGVRSAGKAWSVGRVGSMCLCSAWLPVGGVHVSQPDCTPGIFWHCGAVCPLQPLFQPRCGVFWAFCATRAGATDRLSALLQALCSCGKCLACFVQGNGRGCVVAQAQTPVPQRPAMGTSESAPCLVMGARGLLRQARLDWEAGAGTAHCFGQRKRSLQKAL